MLKVKEIKFISKKCLRKKKRRGVQDKKLIDTPKASIEEEHSKNISHQEKEEKGTKAPSNSSQTVKQIEPNEEVALPEVSNLNDSILNKG